MLDSVRKCVVRKYDPKFGFIMAGSMVGGMAFFGHVIVFFVIYFGRWS